MMWTDTPDDRRDDSRDVDGDSSTHLATADEYRYTIGLRERVGLWRALDSRSGAPSYCVLSAYRSCRTVARMPARNVSATTT